MTLAGLENHWLNVDSVYTTRDEAVRVSAALPSARAQRIVVVTSPMHTRRACAAFEEVGFAVTCVAARLRVFAARNPIGSYDRLQVFQSYLYERRRDDQIQSARVGAVAQANLALPTGSQPERPRQHHEIAGQRPLPHVAQLHLASIRIAHGVPSANRPRTRDAGARTERSRSAPPRRSAPARPRRPDVVQRSTCRRLGRSKAAAAHPSSCGARIVRHEWSTESRSSGRNLEMVAAVLCRHHRVAAEPSSTSRTWS